MTREHVARLYCSKEQDGNTVLQIFFLSKGAQDIYVAEVMIEGNATMDVSGFVSEMIMPVTDTASIVGAEIIAGKHGEEMHSSFRSL